MQSQELFLRDAEAVLGTYNRAPLAIVKGENARCWDPEGNLYIDFTAGIGVNSLGFADPEWAAAVSQQLLTLQHTSNLYYTVPCVEVAELLCARSGMAKVFFANSGAEANEGAIKACRKAQAGKSTIVCLDNSFHGRTVTTLAATGQAVFHQHFHPFTEGFVHVPVEDVQALENAIDGTVGAVMIELVQGEGGVVALSKAYVHAVSTICKKYGILLVVDEVQTGIGRTGSLFCFEQYGIQPDIVTLAKGLGGGLPLGAILFSERAAGILGKGDHATTYGGNPAVTAGAKVILNRMDDAFLKAVADKGAYICERLRKMPHIASVSGLGMMIGAELDGVTVAEVIAAGREAGVLVLSAKAKLRLLPPLTITPLEIEEGLDALQKALASI